ncbi:group II intron maturase-specific domain-containing protein [Virgibacillus dokdonensis]|nr:group II intron maturase-specific domain-containing protein [Virgibacillus dokdonensis]
MKKVFGTLDNKVFYLMTNKFHLNSVSFSFTFPLTTLNSTYLNLLEEILKDHIKNEIYHYPIKSYIQTLKKDHMLILIIYFQYPRHPFLNPNNTLFKIIVNLFENIICCDNTYLIKRFDTSNQTVDIETRIKSKLNPYLRGWANYFRYGNVKSKFREWDSWVRRRLRMVQLRSWRKVKNLHRLLRKKGWREESLRGIRMFAWRSSINPMVHTALDNEYFSKFGLVRLVSVYDERCL